MIGSSSKKLLNFFMREATWRDYASEDITKILKSNALILQSMSRKGNCRDNAVAGITVAEDTLH